MDFLWDSITEWLKELLVGGIISNLSGMFDHVNQKVGEISTQVGTTPQGWNSGVFSMVQNLSETVIVPIAGMILAFVMTLELIQLIIDKNNLNDVDILFLWATFPQLPAALRVISAWGFKYKTVAFLWLKKNRKADSWFFGLGFWTRGNAEVCLLATRGHPKRQSSKIHQFIISPIEAHSKKPDIVRDKIVELAGDVPRIELFARQTTPGWDVWGNEVTSSITL